LGRICLAQMRTNQDWLYHVVGFLDDDPLRKGRTIDGLRVLGDLGDLEDMVRRTGAKVLVVAMRDMSEEEQQRLEGLCSRLGLDCLRLRIDLVPRQRSS